MTYLLAAVLTVIIVITYNLITRKKMKTFSLKANLLAGLTHTVNQLTPTDKATCATDAVEGNRLAIKAIADCELANKEFLYATKATYDKKMAFFEGHKANLKTLTDGKESAEVARINAEQSVILKTELERIDGESTADADVTVEVSVSDEKLSALKKLLRTAVGQWQDSVAYVAVADALDEAKDA